MLIHMKIAQIKEISKEPEFLNMLDDTRRQWILGKSGCGCNNAKIAQFMVSVCGIELKQYAILKGIDL